MNKGIAVMAVGVLVATAGLVYACGNGSDEGKMDMKGMMHHGMMEQKVVATSDGGIVIVRGNTITKYDRNLKLTNEVQMSGMPGMMYKGGCSKCQMKGMEHKMKDYDDDDDDMDQAAGNKGNLNSKDAQGHEAHH